MATHNGMHFTTRDRDNDLHSGADCAVLSGSVNPNGGWWYRACWHYGIATTFANNDNWHTDEVFLNNQFLSLSFIEIKTRPYNCNI